MRKPLTPKEIAAEEARLGRPLTHREKFIPGEGIVGRVETRTASELMRDASWRPAQIQRNTKADALLREISDAEKALQQERLAKMTDAERRLQFVNEGYQDLLREREATAAHKEHISRHREMLTNLRKLRTTALWAPEFTMGDLAAIERAIAQIEVGPNADPDAIRDLYAAALATAARIQDESNASANAQIAALQREIVERSQRLQDLGLNPQVPVAEDEATTEEAKPEGYVEASYWQKYDQYKSLMKAGQTEDAVAALAEFNQGYAAANGGVSPIK